ncbi:MAG: hypothetical protein IJ496_07980 [Ruminococcus sp.]|nr:hypothetical protein [Ruminococcus sp.]
MSEKQFYTAITIGPISETMSLTSSPAGLWCSSYMFSLTAKLLIRELVKAGVPDTEFVSPYFELDKLGSVVLPANEGDLSQKMHNRGVGLFHDHIIIRGSHADKAALAIENVKTALSDLLNADREWLSDFLRIYGFVDAVAVSEGPLTVLGTKLSALELEPQFPARETENPLLKLFANISNDPESGGYANDAVRNSNLLAGLSSKNDWILYRSAQSKCIRDLPDIARGNLSEKCKAGSYYAILSSDGDSMSTILKELRTMEDLRKYSRLCLEYCAKAADLVLRYSGMPIYAGGDDLLAVVPVVGMNPESGMAASIFGLMECLRTLFNETFAKYRDTHDGKPTLSFGVSIQYVKSPLYEALECAEALLHEAKYGDGENSRKNGVRLNLRKHSGQSVKIALNGLDDNGLLSAYEAQILDIMKDSAEADKNTEKERMFLASAGYQFENFRSLFISALKAEDDCFLENLFDNVFDHTEQKKFRPFLNQLLGTAKQLKHIAKVQEKDAEYAYKQLTSYVRFLHFMLEKGEREDA